MPSGEQICVRTVKISNPNEEYTFNSLVSAGKFLSENGHPSSNNRQTIKQYAIEGKPYHGYMWYLSAPAPASMAIAPTETENAPSPAPTQVIVEQNPIGTQVIPPPVPNPLLSSLTAEHGGRVITEIRHDGYVNATNMCQTGGKRWYNYFVNDTTKTFLNELSSNTKIPVLELVQSSRGGAHTGTWVHHQVAIHLAMWISPVFAVAVTTLVTRFFAGHVNLTAQGENVAPQPILEAITGTEFYETNPFELHSETNVFDMRKPQVYMRQVFGKWSKVHPTGRPNEVIPAHELTLIPIYYGVKLPP